MWTLEEFSQKLYTLNVELEGTGSEQHEKPHKPLLLLSAIHLIDKGIATPVSIPWCKALRVVFSVYFDVIKKPSDSNQPKLPYLHLKGDGFWNPITIQDQKELVRRPANKDDDLITAAFSKDVVPHLLNLEQRALVRELLISRYFPQHRKALLELGAHPASNESSSKLTPARSSAFKSKISELYDEKCAACGLRIKLPNRSVSFIDAAHLIPFSESHNDHPSNGMALCKHHHWAMDRNLISPGPDRKWHVSSVFDKRRSSAESDLLALAGSDIILPNDEAFYPSEKALKWRHEQLLHK